MEAEPVKITVAQNVDDWYGFVVYRIPPHQDTVITNGVPTLVNDPGEQFDFTGWTFRATFRASYGAAQTQMVLDNARFTVRTDVPDFVGIKVIIMHIPRTLSDAMTTRGVYDVKARDTNGFEHRLAYGDYDLEMAATRG